MRISIGGKTKDAMKILGVKGYPFTEEDLKKGFRAAMKKAHKDKGGTDEEAMIVQRARIHLQFMVVDISPNMVKHEREVGRFDEKCSDCDGTGTIYHEGYKEYCWDCNGSGKHVNICHSCHGKGKFTQKSGNVVDCYSCKGTGRYIVKCRTCDGKGMFEEQSTRTKCFKCNGKGFITKEPFNPVVSENGILI